MPRARVIGEYTPQGDPLYQDVPLEQIQAQPDRYEIAGDVRASMGGELVQIAPTSDLQLRAGTGISEASAEQLQAASRKSGAEATQGGIVGAGKALLEGAATGGSFGLYDQWRNAVGGTAEKIARQDRALVQSEARLGGEIFGAVLPVALSGGTGAAASIARATPVGLVERGAARIAAMGAGRGGATQAGTRLAGAALEGAADSAGQYLAQQALRDEPLSAEGLAASLGVGALFGAGGSATLQGMSQLNRSVGRLASKLETPAPGPALGDVSQLAGAAKEAGRLRGQLDKLNRAIARETTGEAGERVALGDIVRVPKTPAGIRAQAVKTLKAIDQADGVLARADDALAGVDLVALRATAPELADQLDDVLLTRRAAQQEAQRWGSDFAKVTQDLVDAPRTGKKAAAAAVTDELDTRGVRVLGALDDAQAALDDVLSQVQAIGGAPVQPSKAAGFYNRVTGIGEKVGNLAGAVEVAQTLGAPVPDLDSVPIVGPVLSTYAKARFLMGKFGIGDTKGTPLAQKARFVADLGQRIEAFGSRISLGKIASRTASRALRPDQLAELATNLQDADEARVQDAIGAELKGVPEDVAAAAQGVADRKLQFLRDNLPKPPAAFAQFDSDWKPTPTEALKANAMLRAADEPLDAVEAVLDGKEYLSPVIRETIKAVYPQLWASMQAQVADNATDIYRRRSLAEAVAIGRFFEIPTAPQLTPEYRRAAQTPQIQPPTGDIRVPPPSAGSSMADAHERTLGRGMPE